MFNTPDTFPYIGLRSFSEDDSLYFKGRDEQILQITSLLEANKFLMVTGASGDGKSSLVYAGLVPNARAGFFKATYSNWVIADFRPERTPLKNLSKSISKNLRIGNVDTVEVELKRGFSSLAEIYLSSSLYVDEESDAWITGNNETRENLQRNAANLIIIADQFEEFFTNPENYYRNSPSADSQLVVNLLLETARISIEKNLPIYIVCTMRSDYIGQCASFRGLPEFIGFSQFFVPRLKRKEIVQVVREPAFLHGDRITDRLVERVVYDLGEGIDQLPVLEHAMNEVWIQAGLGKEDLDLIHYAMAGGMSPDELPPEDRSRFRQWFDSLPAKIREAYLHPGLSQIIDAHANKLYLSASDYYNKTHKEKISPAEAQLIIKTAFTCLTKMDEGRAVRNRMSLQEITDILAIPKLTIEVVGGVLNIFREPGNTFLRPYITEDEDSKQLKPDTVLDITHESLIRNWELLKSWAKEEDDHFEVYKDFRKQLDRWIESGKSSGFLLPIGPLTFFENWHNSLNLNKYWVNRYLDPGADKETRLREGARIVEEIKDFLNHSARKVRITRLVVRYGAAKIAAVIGLLFLLGVCLFYYQDARKKVNENVIRQLLAEGKEFIADNGVVDMYRTNFFILAEFLDPGSFKDIMSRLPDEEKAQSIANMHLELIWANTEDSSIIRRQSLYYLDSIIRAVPINENNPASLMRNLKALDLLLSPTIFYLRSHSDDRLQNILDKSLSDIGRIVRLSLTQDFKSQDLDIASINTGLEYALNYKMLGEEEIRSILSKISPYEGANGPNHFAEYFPTGKLLTYSWFTQEFNNLGGYQELAYLYASLGDVPKVEMCVDSLFKLNANYQTFVNGIFNIANYFIIYGQEKNLEDLVYWYCNNQTITHTDFYEQWLNRAGVIGWEFLAPKIAGLNHNPNLELSSIATIQKIFDLYYQAILNEKKRPDELHYMLALYYKHRGALLSKISDEEVQTERLEGIDLLFEEAVENYRKVSSQYLDQITEITFLKNISIGRQQIRRNDLFLYPDHLPTVINNSWSGTKYFTDKYMRFLLNRGYISDLYKTPGDLSQINIWLSNYIEGNTDTRHKQYKPSIGASILMSIDSLLSVNPLAANLNNNLIRLMLIDHYIKTGQYDSIEEFYGKLEPEKFPDNLKEDPANRDDYYYLINRLAGFLAGQGRINEVIRIAQLFPNPSNRIKTYSIAARELLAGKEGPKQDAFILLDSAICEFNRTKDSDFSTGGNSGSDNQRKALVLGLSRVGGKEMHEIAGTFVKQISITRQDDVIEKWIEGTAGSGQYYLAYSAIPDITSAAERVNFINRILLEEAMQRLPGKDWITTIAYRYNLYKWEFLRYDPD